MDFDLDDAQSEQAAALTQALAGAARAVTPDAIDPVFEAACAALASGVDGGFGLLDRVLLVERAASLGAPINATATLLLRPWLPGVPAGPIALRLGGDRHPCRFAETAVAVIELGESTPRFATVATGSFTAIPSGMVSGYGTLVGDGWQDGQWDPSLSPMLVFSLGRAAEVAGNARAALESTTAYLNQRRQFGASLSSLQAVRHRMAELAVDVESLSVLVRIAADHATDVAALSACTCAIDATPRIVRELHQLSGARGFAHESGLPAKTMQMMAARGELLEAGIGDVALADAYWPNRLGH